MVAFKIFHFMSRSLCCWAVESYISMPISTTCAHHRKAMKSITAAANGVCACIHLRGCSFKVRMQFNGKQWEAVTRTVFMIYYVVAVFATFNHRLCIWHVLWNATRFHRKIQAQHKRFLAFRKSLVPDKRSRCTILPVNRYKHTSLSSLK